MLILLILIILLFTGIMIHAKNRGYDDIGEIIIALSLILLNGCLLIVILQQTYFVKKLTMEYNNDKEYIEYCYSNNDLTDSERGRVMQLIRKDNKIIKEVRLYRNNLFIGIFYPQSVGDLELFDYNKIPKVK